MINADQMVYKSNSNSLDDIRLVLSVALHYCASILGLVNQLKLRFKNEDTVSELETLFFHIDCVSQFNQ